MFTRPANLFIVRFTNVDEDRGCTYSYDHSYAFCTFAAAMRFADRVYANCGCDDAGVVRTDGVVITHDGTPWVAPEVAADPFADMPF